MCTGAPDPVELDPGVVRAAVEFLRTVDVADRPAQQWARGLDEPKGNIKADAAGRGGSGAVPGGDAGWWPAVEAPLDAGEAATTGRRHRRVLKRWPWVARPTWITWVPSTRHEALLAATAARLGELGKLPVHQPLRRALDSAASVGHGQLGPPPPQRVAVFTVDPAELPPPDQLAGPVLVLDDALDSGWTMTVVAAALRGGRGRQPCCPSCWPGTDRAVPYLTAT